MRSSFSGLDLAYRALQAQQQAIEVLNHNIANANTPGYSRQTAHLGTTPPYTIPSMNMSNMAGQVGTGVAVIDILRSRNAFVDLQIRLESQTLGRWEMMRDALKQVEVVFNEPSEAGLNSLMSKFWQAWQELANAPHDVGARRALVEQADSLAVAFNRGHSHLTNIQQDLDRQFRVGAGHINELAQQIADLNNQIIQVEAMGQRANDLRDTRDLLLDELSTFVRATSYEAPDGSLSVFLGSKALVIRSRAEQVALDEGGTGFATMVWKDGGDAVQMADGKLSGLQQARDVEVPLFVGDLDALAGGIVGRVNQLHLGGFGLDNSTGISFFAGAGASDMAVNPALRANPEQIAAAASTNAPGDNSTALAIARLQRELTMSGGVADFGRFFGSTIARLGVNSQRADMMASNQMLLVNHLRRQRESASGVSLDEETTHLIEFQRAYQAAARVVSAIDEMLDKLINGTGLVGR